MKNYVIKKKIEIEEGTKFTHWFAYEIKGKKLEYICDTCSILGAEHCKKLLRNALIPIEKREEIVEELTYENGELKTVGEENEE